MGVTLIFRNQSRVRRAYVRDEHGIRDAIVADPELGYREAEKAMLHAAATEGLPANERTIHIQGDPAKPKDRGLVSYPDKPARGRTRYDKE